MTQADRVFSTPPTNTSVTRRKVLGTAAVAAAALAATGASPMALPAAAGATEPPPPDGFERVLDHHGRVWFKADGMPDPIFAAIEAHKAARAIWVANVYRHSDLENELPRDKRRSCVHIEEYKIFETDDPRWIECEHEVMRTSDLETDAACVLVSIIPTTQAGVVALLQYALLADTDGEGWPRDLVSDDGTKARSWHYFLIENVTAALTDLVSA
jgi:hypothetical protein